MGVGPIEYIVVGFPGNKFNGEIAPELAKLIDGGMIRILDLVFIGKDDNGEVVAFEFDQLDELAAFADLEGEVGGFLNEQDIEYAAAALEPGSSAALLVWEDRWAAPFAEAIRDSGGVLLEGARIPHELVGGRPGRHRSGRLSPPASPATDRHPKTQTRSRPGGQDMLRRRPTHASGSDDGGGGRHGRCRAAPPGPEVRQPGRRSRRRPQQYDAAPARQPAEDPYEALKKLAELHDQGILTDEEFAAQKAKILG